jgi:hypothetical protein
MNSIASVRRNSVLHTDWTHPATVVRKLSLPAKILKDWPPTYHQQLPDGILRTGSPESESTLAVELQAPYCSVPYVEVMRVRLGEYLISYPG